MKQASPDTPVIYDEVCLICGSEMALVYCDNSKGTVEASAALTIPVRTDMYFALRANLADGWDIIQCRSCRTVHAIECLHRNAPPTTPARPPEAEVYVGFCKKNQTAFARLCEDCTRDCPVLNQPKGKVLGLQGQNETDPFICSVCRGNPVGMARIRSEVGACTCGGRWTESWLRGPAGTPPHIKFSKYDWRGYHGFQGDDS